MLKQKEHDPEKCVAVFPRDKREAFARRSCSNKKPAKKKRKAFAFRFRIAIRLRDYWQ